MQVPLLYGGHQKVIDVVGGAIEQQTRKKNVALRFEIASPDLCRVL
jgi:hypothetical protein